MKDTERITLVFKPRESFIVALFVFSHESFHTQCYLIVFIQNLINLRESSLLHSLLVPGNLVISDVFHFFYFSRFVILITNNKVTFLSIKLLKYV